jgi:hypothetical protein
MLTKNCRYSSAVLKVLKVSLLSLVVSLIPSSFQSANSSEILWNPGIGNDLSGAGAGLVPGAGIRNTGLLVNKSNPDELIMKIIMSESFEDKPFSGKGRNMGIWIYWPKNYCWGEGTANCEGLFIVGIPLNPPSYPSAKSSEYVFVNKHDKAANVDVKPTTCKAPWWIESTYKSRDTWSFAVSITCLGIPKEFGWYAYSEISIGQKDIVADFTTVQTITYPFHDLAASAASKNTQNKDVLPRIFDETNKQVCVLGTTGKGYAEVTDIGDEQCSDLSSWQFNYCDVQPRAELQIFKNKKWQKVKQVKGVKGESCETDKVYEFTFSTPLLGQYRIKHYGNSKLLNSYINLKIYKKNVA